MLIKRIKYLTLGAVIFLAPLTGMTSAFADFDNMDTVMTISPPTQKIILAPGENYEGSISVSSPTAAKSDLDYSVTVGTYGISRDDDGKANYDDVDLNTVSSYNQMIDWIELKKDKGIIPKGDTEVIPYVIHVPENAPAGGQYATIVVQNDTEIGNTGDSGIAIESKMRFASVIMAEVTGETKKEGEIKENDIPSFLLNNLLTATSTVKNNGNVHTDAEYTLQVWPIFSDEEICTNEEEKETSLIMPDTERFHAQTCALPSIGIFRAKQTVSIFGEISEVERTIIFCPLYILFLILFAIIALVAWIIYRVKANKKRAASSSDK